jgi:hypothetical protein
VIVQLFTQLGLGRDRLESETMLPRFVLVAISLAGLGTASLFPLPEATAPVNNDYALDGWTPIPTGSAKLFRRQSPDVQTICGYFDGDACKVELGPKPLRR